MTFVLIKTIHLFAAFIYGGFLIVDNLFLVKIKKSYNEEEHKEIRESFMKYVRKVVPPMLLSLKAFLGIWLGLRGGLQVYFGIQPFVFKSHVLPFAFVVTIIFLSQFMYI
jgi:hypothetical protein